MRYYIIAGEPSGDLHGSNLVRGLLAEDPGAQLRIWGGDLMMEAAGPAATLVRHYKECAVMGISDVIAKLPAILGNERICRADILQWRPDVVILIDYPGFNMRIARFCHKRGIKVFYYIAPKTWASRESRNASLKAFVDRLFIVFPFEIQYFAERGIPFVYKGNPLVDAVDGHDFGAPPVQGRYVALLPGSRKGEISRMMPVCMQVADELGCKVVVAGAPSRTPDDYAPWTGGRDNVQLVFARTYDVLKYADAAIINSGTASLEAALIGTPQVVCWSTSRLTWLLAKYVFKVGRHVKFISLGNLCIGRAAFRELLQDDFNVRQVSSELRRLLCDGSCRERMLRDYDDIRASLGGSGASRAVARAMIEELTAKKSSL